MTISFGNDQEVVLISEGASWRTWDLSGEGKQTAEVFRFSHDPGALENGNFLCSQDTSERVLFAVFHESYFPGGTRLLEMAVFRSDEPPFDVNSEGLCVTLSYSAE